MNSTQFAVDHHISQDTSPLQRKVWSLWLKGGSVASIALTVGKTILETLVILEELIALAQKK